MTKLVTATALGILSTFLGGHWGMFAFFFLLNVLDFLTDLAELYLSKTYDRRTVIKDILLKLGYWVIIAIAFGLSGTLISLGNMIGIDLHFSMMIGWFVLIGLSFDEIRNIFQSLTKVGVHVPLMLTRFLMIAETAVDRAEDTFLQQSERMASAYAGELVINTKDPEKPTMRLELRNDDISLLQNKEEVRVKIVNESNQEGR